MLRLALLLALAPLSLGAETAANPAVVPVSKLENDSYDWFKRHEEARALAPKLKPDIVLIGDSITHFWGGLPQGKDRGAKSWADLFGDRKVLNLGFGWDRIQNALWRLDNGEMDGTDPRLVVVNIGTNNLANTKNCRTTTPEETAAGVALLLERVKARAPHAKVVVMAVFPRGATAASPDRARVAALNTAFRPVAEKAGATWLDIGPKFLAPDGSIPKSLMGDALHPTDAGYAIWAEALKPHLPK